jgi:ferredoxin-NADP reductase/MOSC domain-containing protein YiiM
VATLVSVNVGMPQDVSWRGKTVHTGVWKHPVDGEVMVRRLNLDGDGQGDLNGHGGEQRAVLVYQTESYEYWKAHFNRGDLVPGHFGENFTITGLSDQEVCIGDRYRIGDAEFEVTQPRVTCFRVGMRLGEPEMPNLLVAHRRPGFYLRVIAEGRVTAGDGIERTRRGRHELSVADVDALLYLPDRDVEMLRKAVEVEALSPGWQQSFRELLEAHDVACAPTAPTIAWNGFRRFRVSDTHSETPSVLSISLEPEDEDELPRPLPGQYLTIRIPDAGDPAPMRSYSLSGDPTASHYRISVKREAGGQVSRWLHEHIEPGSLVDIAAPRGDFYLVDGDGPVILLSAGIGATPVLAMLHTLALTKTNREIWWLHTTHDAASHAFANEAAALIKSLPDGRQRIFYTTKGERLDRRAIASLQLPRNATVYLCGPTQFMDSMRDDLAAAGIDPTHIHSELFGALPPINPGVVDGAQRKRPHPPDGQPGTGPHITFARSGLSVDWSPSYRTILELAEACDVPTRYSCRSGVCHTCATGVVGGEASYIDAPLEPPPDGTVLICTSTPTTDLVLDL